jgi:hypothetical protein
MDFSTLFHGVSTWLFRIAILGGVIGFGYFYMNGDGGLPGARMAAEQLQNAAPACQPIGHTARDELVFSMDCEALPAGAASK